MKFPSKFTVPVPSTSKFVAKTSPVNVEVAPFAPAFTSANLFSESPTVPVTVWLLLPTKFNVPLLSAVVVTFPVNPLFKFAVPLSVNCKFEVVVPDTVLKFPVPVVIVVVVAVRLSWKVLVPAFTFTFVAVTLS